jgi:hypothetical protein
MLGKLACIFESLVSLALCQGSKADFYCVYRSHYARIICAYAHVQKKKFSSNTKCRSPTDLGSNAKSSIRLSRATGLFFQFRKQSLHRAASLVIIAPARAFREGNEHLTGRLGKTGVQLPSPPFLISSSSKRASSSLTSTNKNVHVGSCNVRSH